MQKHFKKNGLYTLALIDQQNGNTFCKNVVLSNRIKNMVTFTSDSEFFTYVPSKNTVYISEIGNINDDRQYGVANIITGWQF